MKTIEWIPITTKIFPEIGEEVEISIQDLYGNWNIAYSRYIGNSTFEILCRTYFSPPNKKVRKSVSAWRYKQSITHYTPKNWDNSKAKENWYEFNERK